MRLVAILSVLLAGNAGAIVNGFVPDENDTTYDAVGALGTYAGLTQGHEWHCAATLIAENKVLTAGHCVEPGVEYGARFRRAFDGTVGSVEGSPETFYNTQVSSWYFPEVGDVAIGYLAHPVPHIEPIPLSFQAVGLEALAIAGWGREGPAMAEGRKRRLKVCDNEATYADAEQINAYSAWNTLGPLCGINSNDSGGPALVWLHGGVKVVGAALDYTAFVAMEQYATDSNFNPQLLEAVER